MMYWSRINVQCIALFAVLRLVSAQQCPGEIGRDDTNPGSVRRSNQFYLNRGSPATCDGMITSFSYCYFRPSDSSPNEYLVTFAVYRPQGGREYRRVSPTIVLRKTRTETYNELGRNNFACSSLNLDQPVSVQDGDVLGACVIDFPGGNVFRLDIASRRVSDNGAGNLLRAEVAPTSCTATSVPNNINFDNVGGDITSTRVLFLSAVIEETTQLPITTQTLESTTVVTSTEPSTTKSTTASTESTTVVTSTEPSTTKSTTASTESTTVVTSTEPSTTKSTTASTESTTVVTSTEPSTTKSTTASTESTTVVTSTEPSTTKSTTASTESTTVVTSTEPSTTKSTTASTESTIAVTSTEPLVTMDSTTAVTSTESTNISGLVTTGGSGNELRTTSTTISEEFFGSSNEVTIAIVVVIVLIIVIVSIVILTVAIVLLWRRRNQTKKSYLVTGNSSINNQLYDVAGENAPDGSQFQEHEYEFDASRSNGHAYYAEVGPFDETALLQNEIVYASPLDASAPAISYTELLEKNKEENIYVGENPYEVPATREGDIYTQLKSWGVKHIKTEEFQTVGHLGSGQFGSVEQGVWKRQGTRPVDVALKSLTKTSGEDKVKFLQEAAIMAQFKHPNVIMLHGVVMKGDPIMLVVELAKKGDLKRFLHSLQPDPGELTPSSTPKLLLMFCQHVALGMQYLSAKGFVHRDLAARNVLLTNNNICKVADFGMSRDLADEDYYVSHGGMIPVKWTAPEALHYKKYSTASDVWAYGCLLYETWSLGHRPFEGVSNFEVIRLLDSGKRLSPPPGCPKMIYELMMLCWHFKPSQRVSFRDIVLTLVGSEEIVLKVPKDSPTNPLAVVLGAPLEAGKIMYPELQKRYLS